MPPIKSSDAALVPLRMAALALRFPDCVTVGAAANIAKTSRQTIYNSDIPFTIEEGLRLYKISDVQTYARNHTRREATKLIIKGIDVERVRKICETFYRTQLDTAEHHLLALAKRIARL
jgi:hypothetical protein